MRSNRGSEVISSMVIALGIGVFWVSFLIILFTISASAATYEFKYKENTKVLINANSKYKAYKDAAMLCYRTLSKNVYPGEDRGMEIIDICANPYNYDSSEISK